MSFPQWFCAMCAPRSEAEAAANLRRAGYWVFYPHIRERVRKKQRGTDRKLLVEVERPLFPRYVFVALRGFRDSFEGIENAIGVLAIVRRPMSKVPLQIPNAAMTLLMDWADGDGLCPAATVPHGFKGRVGDMVEYTDGAFDRVLASIASLEPLVAGDEIRIWLELLGHKVETTVPLSAVKLVEARA